MVRVLGSDVDALGNFTDNQSWSLGNKIMIAYWK